MSNLYPFPTDSSFPSSSSSSWPFVGGVVGGGYHPIPSQTGLTFFPPPYLPFGGGDYQSNPSQTVLTYVPPSYFQPFGGGDNHPNPSQTVPTYIVPPCCQPFGGGGSDNPDPSQTGPTSLPTPSRSSGGSGNHTNPSQTGPTSLPPPSRSSGGSGNHPNPSQTGPTSLPTPSRSSGGSENHPNPSQTGPIGGSGNHPNPSQTGPTSSGSSLTRSSSFSFGSPTKNGVVPPSTTTTADDGHLTAAPKFLESDGPFTISPEEEAFKSRTPSSSLTHLSPQLSPPPPPHVVYKVTAAASPNPSLDDFEGEISSMTADKAFILKSIKRGYPSCLSSLRLRSKLHRQTAYDHLVQVIQDFKAIRGSGGPDSYDEVLTSLDDLEVYGFSMGWLREEVVQLQRGMKEKEAKQKVREELTKRIKNINEAHRRIMKRIEAIDAEVAARDDPPPLLF